MHTHRFQMNFILGLAFAGAIFLPTLCLAQGQLDAKGEYKEDNRGCPEITVPLKLPMSVIASCDKGDWIEVTMPLKPDAQGYPREKRLRGAYEFHQYQMPETFQQEQIFDNLTQLLVIAGFTVKYSSSPSVATARNMNTWVLVKVSGQYYDVSIERVKEEPWAPVVDAQGISREMEAHNRVAIYGIAFSSDNQTVIEANSRILGEVLAYLKGSTRLTIDVEGHKMTYRGNAEDDLEITRKRAKAVVAWLEAHGIPTGRLQPKGLGQTKPVTENDTPLEIQRNERIELAKTPS